MDLDTLIQTITDNPLISGGIAGTLAAVAGFFGPIMRAVQAALIRRIDQAWAQNADEDNIEERVRKTTSLVIASTVLPLPSRFVENRVRNHKSEAPPPP